jgi:hypothetical protein
MTTRIVKSLCLLSAVALWPGCSSSSDTSDAATDNDAATNADTASDGPPVGLSRGINYYKVTAVTSTVATDGCELNPNTFLNETLPANFVESTAIFSIGNPQGSPVMPSLGSGRLAGNNGTLNRENDTTDGMGCSWHQKDVSLFELTGIDVFTLDVTETQSAFNGCPTFNPPGGTCTSLYKLTLAKTTAPADAGTGG